MKRRLNTTKSMKESTGKQCNLGETMNLIKIMSILSEKDHDKQKKMIAALSDEEKQAYLEEAEKLHKEASQLRVN